VNNFFSFSFIDGKSGKRREQTVKHSVADFIDENGVICQVGTVRIFWSVVLGNGYFSLARSLLVPALLFFFYAASGTKN
jgi:hypothetical protein